MGGFSYGGDGGLVRSGRSRLGIGPHGEILSRWLLRVNNLEGNIIHPTFSWCKEPAFWRRPL